MAKVAQGLSTAGKSGQAFAPLPAQSLVSSHSKATPFLERNPGDPGFDSDIL